jgi:hypothetical protein
MAMVRLIPSAYIASELLGRLEIAKGWERARNTMFVMETFCLRRSTIQNLTMPV